MKTPFSESLFNKVEGLKKRDKPQVLSLRASFKSIIFKSILFTEHLQATASKNSSIISRERKRLLKSSTERVKFFDSPLFLLECNRFLFPSVSQC